MSEPVDIKIAHINKSETINNALNKEAVYEIFSKSNFEAIAPFYKFQQAWVNRAYEVFKYFVSSINPTLLEFIKRGYSFKI